MKKNAFLLTLVSAFVLGACSDDNDGPMAPPPPSSAVNMTEFCCKDGVLYGFLSQYDEAWNRIIVHSAYNTFTGDVQAPWVTDGTVVSSPYKLMSAGDYICLSASDYVNDGDVYLFTPDGRLYDSFSAGIGPRRAVTVDNFIYILNEGLYNANNSSLTRYNVDDASVVKDCFMEANDKRIGDTANDICLYGSKMYIAVAEENVIWVTDKSARILKKIETAGKPRYFVTAEGSVFATLFNGHVARIDTLAMCVDATIPVGRNPEQLCAVGRKLFVANSGGLDYNTEVGYDKTVSVIDIPSFTEIKKIEVATNPSNILASENGYVYLVSLGNYSSIPNTLQCINPDTYEVTLLNE